jgi:hypothetical protein
LDGWGLLADLLNRHVPRPLVRLAGKPGVFQVDDADSRSARGNLLLTKEPIRPVVIHVARSAPDWKTIRLAPRLRPLTGSGSGSEVSAVR